MFPAPRQQWVDAMRTSDDEIRKLPHETLAKQPAAGTGVRNRAQT
jgi:hypothetical protein